MPTEPAAQALLVYRTSSRVSVIPNIDEPAKKTAGKHGTLSMARNGLVHFEGYQLETRFVHNYLKIISAAA